MILEQHPIGIAQMPGFENITAPQLDAFQSSLRAGQYNLLLV